MKKLIVSTVVFALLFGATSALVSAQDPALSPGLYVTDLRITPDPPTNDAALTFYATFNNTAGGDQNLRWLVYIYRTSNMRVSLGETASSLTTFPAGTSEMQALGYWKLGPGSPCDNFVARVGVLDGINPPLLLTQSDGKLFEKKFTVCPPADDPVVRAPGAGLFVTDLRVSPDPPTNNVGLTFYPTFQNTDNQTLSFTWLVYVYWASAPKNSYGETSALTTEFPAGKGEYPSLGYWKMGPGYPCTQFLARVGWLDIDHNTQFFTTPDGKVFEKSFTVCPPADAPVVRAPGAGLFVTDLRISPDPPTNDATLTFYPTFQNTDNQTWSATWLVYVYWAGGPKNSYGETAAVTTDFPAGKGEYPTLGYWKMGPGYPCTQFVARVGWLDIDHNTQFFTTPDGKVFEKGFTVCAP